MFAHSRFVKEECSIDYTNGRLPLDLQTMVESEIKFTYEFYSESFLTLLAYFLTQIYHFDPEQLPISVKREVGATQGRRSFF